MYRARFIGGILDGQEAMVEKPVEYCFVALPPPPVKINPDKGQEAANPYDMKRHTYKLVSLIHEALYKFDPDKSDDLGG